MRADTNETYMRFELHALPPGMILVADDDSGDTVIRLLAIGGPEQTAAIVASRQEILDNSPKSAASTAAPIETVEPPPERPVVTERLNTEFFKQVILERGGQTVETALLQPIEWHAAAVIAESGRRGVTYAELIERVPGWSIEDIPAMDGKPEKPATTSNAVDVVVSKIGKKFREARIPFQISREEREVKTENGRILRKIFLFFERLNL